MGCRVSKPCIRPVAGLTGQANYAFVIPMFPRQNYMLKKATVDLEGVFKKRAGKD